MLRLLPLDPVLDKKMDEWNVIKNLLRLSKFLHFSACVVLTPDVGKTWNESEGNGIKLTSSSGRKIQSLQCDEEKSSLKKLKRLHQEKVKINQLK